MCYYVLLFVLFNFVGLLTVMYYVYGLAIVQVRTPLCARVSILQLTV